MVENVLDSDDFLVVFSEVAEGDSGLKADERGRQVEQHEGVTLAVAYEPCSAASFIKAVPRPAGRIDLVGLKLPLVL